MQAGAQAATAATGARHAGFFVLRSPFLPFHVITELSVGLEAAAAESAHPEALERDRRTIRARLRALVESPAIGDALYVASPDLHRAIPVWRDMPDSERGAAIERALYRYVTRMAARATPFGLFAGTGVGAVGQPTRLALAAQSAARRHTRLDMDYLVRVTDAISHAPSFAGLVRFEPNSSLHAIGGRWHYVETRLVNEARSHQLVAVDRTESLDATLARAANGATRDALAAALADAEITESEACGYIDELIANQLLVPELASAVTGAEPLSRLITVLGEYPAAGEHQATLASVAEDLACIDRHGVGVAAERYQAIADRLAPFGVTIEPSRLLQVDLVRPLDSATISADLLADMARGAELLRRLSPGLPDEGMARLREAFSDRYELTEVSLVEMLDEEAGIGSALAGGRDRDASSLLQDLHFPDPPSKTAAWSHREHGLLQRVGDALMGGRHILTLSATDVDALAVKDVAPLPPAFAVTATLCGDPATRDHQILLHGVSGPSGANLLGRFCHADPALEDRVRAHLAAEEALDPDAIYAEIVHLPEGRLGNILIRPHLRSHEIVYLGRSGLPREQQIPITDLLVSLAGDRFVLRSRRFGKPVVPRLTSAHNFMPRAIGVYRFLCLLQADGWLPGAAWHWGALDALPFLPRVTHDRFVLTRARWRLAGEDIRVLSSPRAPARYDAVQAWRARRRLPRWVVLADHDNTLVVDLDNVLAVDSFVQMLHGRDEAHLTELYPGPDDLPAVGPEGRYVHEIVVPFTLDRVPPTIHRIPSTADRSSSPIDPEVASTVEPFAPAIVRHALPGSEWVYAKLYAGHAAADRLLRDVIGPLSRRLVNRGAVDRWFFIRYADPHHHIRWRLQLSSPARLASVRRAVEREAARLAGAQQIERFAYDTYHREIERYGGPDGMDIAESLFHVDSDTMLSLLAAAGGTSATADTRWQAALVSTDRWLADLGLDVSRRLAVIRSARDEWGRRLHANQDVRRQLAKRYRGVRVELARLLEGRVDPEHALAAILEILRRRTIVAHPLVERLRSLHADKRLSVSLDAIAESLVHMHLNRIIRAEQNLHEVVLYDFLAQLYKEQLARRS